jgi:hypothetical protein
VVDGEDVQKDLRARRKAYVADHRFLNGLPANREVDRWPREPRCDRLRLRSKARLRIEVRVRQAASGRVVYPEVDMLHMHVLSNRLQFNLQLQCKYTCCPAESSVRHMHGA